MGKHSIRLLSFALRYPVGWHGYGKDRTTRGAVANLEAKGFLEVSRETKQFRLAIPAHVRRAIYSTHMAAGE